MSVYCNFTAFKTLSRRNRTLTYYLFVLPDVKPTWRLTTLRGSVILELSGTREPLQGVAAMLRKAAFSGNWYPAEPARLRKALESYIGGGDGDEEVVGVVAPHAGYMYSGPVAGAVYGRVRIPDTVVVLCVNHRGVGSRAAVMGAGEWDTPLGPVPIQEELAQDLMKRVGFLEEDAVAHAGEHSLEMQVPFLVYRNPGVRILPISLQRLDYEECVVLGQGLAEAVRHFPTPVLLVASTDMTHFEAQERAKKKDMLAVDKVLEVDPQGLYDTVTRHRISMCGFIPTTAVLCACKALGVSKGTLVRYATSGDVSGDYSSVVGYAGICLP
jgi:AmmeMemoRadiSam system protein B